MAGFQTGNEWAVTIVEARGLKAADVTGVSDAYCVVHWSSGDEGHTHVERFTLNPKFGERFASHARQQYFIVEVFDKDTLTTDDFLGELKVKLNDGMPDRTDNWFKLTERMGESRGVTGELHLVIEKIAVRV